MQSKKGSATVPVALFGVSPNIWYGRCHSPFGVPGRVRKARRRDADESGRDDRAPQLQLHRSGLELVPKVRNRAFVGNFVERIVRLAGFFNKAFNKFLRYAVLGRRKNHNRT